MNAGLLGPNGQPMEKYLEHAGRPKNPKPVVGDAFADWGGMSRDFIHLPGGGVIGFDTSKLGIKDFRRMREHYQIGSSLHVLTFMLHQLDWRIECDDPKVAAWCTVNLEMIWTRLIRAMSTAFAFGFSANAVEWENDSNEGKLRLNKIKDLVPEECEVSWKYVDSSIRPNGNVSAPKVPIFDGISKRGTSYKIPVENSLWYPLLMENGDYRGRQLLRTAFQPWFFSTLIHLYQNKYFERFGEPVPIGRAPYNDKVTKDGKTVYGYDLMATILSNIRSRSAVVLPNSRSKEGMNDQPEYDYQVEYLEAQMRGADFERYLTRLDEEMSLALFTPLLLLRTADAGGFNQGVAHCVTPETPMLMEDLTWKPAGELVPGDRLISFDEEPTYGRGNGNNARCFAVATVEANGRVEKPCMEIRTDNGQPITASKDHPFMVWRRMTGSGRNMGLVWVNAEDLKVGDRIAKFADPWSDETANVSQRDLGWIAGFFDGEGSIKKNESNAGYVGRSQELAVHQVDGPVLSRALEILDKMEVDYTLSDGRRSSIGGKFVHTVRINGGFRGVVRFLGLVRPVRLLNNFEPDWAERGVRRNQTYDLATVTQLTDVGPREVATVQTSTGTFITAGYLSHNTQVYLWMLNAVAGDMAEYIDKYVLRYMAIYNFGPKAKLPRIRFRKLGTAQQETLRAIVQAMIGKGQVKPDVTELGQHIGLTLEEIEEVTEPGPDPDAVDEDDEELGDNGNKDGRVGRPERLKDQDGIKPGSTTKQISARIAEQIKRAYKRNDLLDWKPAPGFHRQLTGELQAMGHMDARRAASVFNDTVIGVLSESAKLDWSSAEEFIAYAEGIINAEGEKLYASA
ncbi:portal protein [Gordonia phage Newt]|uniref:Portal protein n=3 Tax=Woesvirus woes TaxID=1982751 RepID=A0A482JJP7_9CAUD|nr:portal protein [Gordonia phage Nimi13]QDH48256.1 portal protein [Gordonia phage Luker]QDH48655.1 portal protein [Gordonia phage Newt]